MNDILQPDNQTFETGTDAIVAAAAECFMTSGFSDTSIDDVAHALGATKGRIYHYYRSKVELFFDVHRRGMAININSIKPISKGSETPAVRLKMMCEIHLMNMLTTLSFQRVVMQGVEMHLASPTTPQQREKLKVLMKERERYEGFFRSVLIEGKAAGQFSFENASFASKAVLAVLNNPVLWYKPKGGGKRCETGNLSEQEIIDQFTQFALNTVRCEQAARESGNE